MTGVKIFNIFSFNYKFKFSLLVYLVATGTSHFLFVTSLYLLITSCYFPLLFVPPFSMIEISYNYECLFPNLYFRQSYNNRPNPSTPPSKASHNFKKPTPTKTETPILNEATIKKEVPGKTETITKNETPVKDVSRNRERSRSPIGRTPEKEKTSTVKDATEESNNAKIVKYKGRPGEKKFSGKCRLFIANLNTSMKEEEVKILFEPYGDLSEVYFNKDKGFGFVRLVSSIFYYSINYLIWIFN